MGVPTRCIFTTIAQHSEKGQNTKNPTTWVIGQPTEWIGSGLAIMSQNVPAAAETSYLVLFLPGCASIVLYCAVLCLLWLLWLYQGHTRVKRGGAAKNGSIWPMVKHLCRIKPQKFQHKSGGFFDKSKPNEDLHPNNLGGENHLHCQVSAFRFLYKRVTAKRHDLKYGISAKYYHWDFSSAGQF